MACRSRCASRLAARRPTQAWSPRSPSSCEAKVIERLGQPLAEPIFEELAIIGVGLIGSSIARAARRRNAARRLVLADRSVEVLERAKALGLGDLVTDDLARAASYADCVILCAPVGASEAIGRVIAPALQQGAVVSDVGSVKGAVV